MNRRVHRCSAIVAASVAMAATLACTANVQDLGTPSKPTDPLTTVAEACLQWPLQGKPCDASGPLACNPTSTLQCVCGYDGTWVCLDASLGLLSAHALDDRGPCGGGVIYADAVDLCSCDDYGQLVCTRRQRSVPESEHAP